MVSDFRLARQRATVSLPPEKICSTATAEPGRPVKNVLNKEMNHYLGWIEYPAQGKRDCVTATK